MISTSRATSCCVSPSCAARVAVHIEVQFRHVGHLMDMDIHCARHMLATRAAMFLARSIVRRIVADDLDVDGGGEVRSSGSG